MNSLNFIRFLLVLVLVVIVGFMVMLVCVCDALHMLLQLGELGTVIFGFDYNCYVH